MSHTHFFFFSICRMSGESLVTGPGRNEEKQQFAVIAVFHEVNIPVIGDEHQPEVVE